jgi:small conductance mechanosensitive channel
MQWSDVVDAVGTGVGHVAAAAAIAVAGYVTALVARSVVGRLLRRHESVLGPSVVRLATRAVYYILLALTVAVGLIALGVPATLVSAVVVLILVVLAVALQQSVADLAATVIFLVFQPFKRAELVQTMGQLGEVHEILLFNTVLLLPDHRLVSLPNSKIQADGIVNYTRMGQIRVDFTFTVAYGENLNRVREVLLEIASNDRRVLSSPPFEVVVADLTEVGVRVLVLPTVAPEDYWTARSDLREQVKARFDAEGIRFAVPPREVILRQPTAAPPDRA